MDHNITANRLNDYAEFVKPYQEPDEYGQPQELYTTIFDCRCDVEVKSGSQLDSYGIPITESMITLLTWFNDKVKSGQRILWNNQSYEVQHIQPDGRKKSMIVTAAFHGDQSYD